MLRHAGALIVLPNAALSIRALLDAAQALRRVACAAAVVELRLLATATILAQAAVLQRKAFAALNSARSIDREALSVAGAALEPAPGLVSEAAAGIFVPATVLRSGTLGSVALVLDPYAGELRVGPLLSFFALWVTAFFLNTEAKVFIPSEVVRAILYKLDFSGASAVITVVAGTTSVIVVVITGVVVVVVVVTRFVVVVITGVASVVVAIIIGFARATVRAHTFGLVPEMVSGTVVPFRLPLV